MEDLPSISNLTKRIVKLAKSRQFQKYIASGLISFLVDFAIFRVLYINIHAQLTISTFIGIVSGLITGFLLQKLWVFKGKHIKKVHGQLAIYSLLTIVNTLFTKIVIKEVENSGLSHGAEIGKVMAAGIIVIWNFAIFKLVVFREKN